MDLRDKRQSGKGKWRQSAHSPGAAAINAFRRLTLLCMYTCMLAVSGAFTHATQGSVPPPRLSLVVRGGG